MPRAIQDMLGVLDIRKTTITWLEDNGSRVHDVAPNVTSPPNPHWPARHQSKGCQLRAPAPLLGACLRGAEDGRRHAHQVLIQIIPRLLRNVLDDSTRLRLRQVPKNILAHRLSTCALPSLPLRSQRPEAAVTICRTFAHRDLRRWQAKVFSGAVQGVLFGKRCEFLKRLRPAVIVVVAGAVAENLAQTRVLDPGTGASTTFATRARHRLPRSSSGDFLSAACS